MEYLIIWLLFAMISCVIGISKGHVVLGFFLGPFAILTA